MEDGMTDTENLRTIYIVPFNTKKALDKLWQDELSGKGFIRNTTRITEDDLMTNKIIT